MAEQSFDALGRKISLTKDDFEFVQRNEQIFDKKFDTKPTTFLKDALRRFCKNKSSVAGAFIIGIIVILAIFVPIFSPYNIVDAQNSETLMLPKLFESGTGFWDGTERRIKQACYYDEATDTWIPGSKELPNLTPSKNSIKDLVHYQEDGIDFCDYTYDKYEDRYGEKVSHELWFVDLAKYEDLGWCVWEYHDDGTFTFELTELGEEKCPYRSIESINLVSLRATGVISQYRYLGYDKYPVYIFGTDTLGHDIVKKSFRGLGTSLIFAICIASICFVVGLVWGSVSGYFGGNVDLIMERFCDILGGVPTVVVVTLFRLHLGDALWVFALSLCLTGWMGTAARTRTQFYRFKGREYVLASRTLGATDTRLIFRHILPNSLGTIVTSTVLMIPGLIFTESSLSYLGLGLKGSNSFGDILATNQGQLQIYPMLIVFPAIIISLLMISFNLFGNGLRDALNPSLKGSE